MIMAAHIVSFILGLVLLVVFFRSVIALTLVTCHRYEPIADMAARVSRAVFDILMRFTSSQEQLENCMLWFWPVATLSIIGLWFLVVMTAFGCFYWATGATPTWGTSLIASGSALSTLGFQTPVNLQGRVLAIMQGAIGLFIMVYLLTFLPGQLASIQQRAEKVAWLYARIGSPPSGLGIIVWWHEARGTGSMSDFWETWERWFVELGQSHSASPILIRTRSFRAGEHWVLAAGALMDAAVLAKVLLEVPERDSSQYCLNAGIEALNKIVTAFGPCERIPAAVPVQVTREQFDRGHESLRVVGVPVKGRCEHAWQEFANRRLQYEYLLLELARRTIIDMPSWLPPDDRLSTGSRPAC